MKQPHADSRERPSFATTRWSLVAAAGSATEEARGALAALCEAYWYPLYAYVRRRGHAPADAQDLTQEFFAFLLEKKSWRAADQRRGRFRSFLLASLNNFLANARRRDRAAKQGGGAAPLAIDFADGERRFAAEPLDKQTPERIYERRWAMTTLARAVERLKVEMAAAGKGELCEALLPHVAGGREAPPYAEVAARLGMTEGAVKTAAHRLRQKCRAALRDEIAETVADENEIDDELRDLLAALGG